MPHPRTLGPLLVLAVLGVGCMAPPPAAEELRLEDAQAPLEAEVVSIPTAAQPPPPPPAPPVIELFPAGRPHVAFVDAAACDSDEPECFAGIGQCGFTIETSGFPAISADGTEVVAFEYMGSSGADMDVGTYQLVWRSAADDRLLRSTPLADGSQIGRDTDWGGVAASSCAEEAGPVVQAVASVEATLRDGWRSLPPLPVQTQLPGWRLDELDLTDEQIEALEAPVAPALRPVEAHYHGTTFYLRVKGIEVVFEHASPDWLGLPPDLTMNSTEPNISALWGDAASGVAVVAMDYESASCMSDTDAVYHVVQLPPEAFEAIAKRAGNVRDAEPQITR